MKASRSAYFAWRANQVNPTARMIDDAELGELVVKVHDQSFGTYGWRRVTAELRLGLGREVNHKRVQRLMRERGLSGVTRRRRTKGCTRSRVTDPRSDDLVHRQFRPDGPDRLWVQDVTQHRSGEGWVYLAVVIDAWSRRVVGWSIADHMRAELVADAIDMATWRRRPPAGAIAHSDHGSNYCSWVFGQRLRSAGLIGSMGTVGDALDNAVAESLLRLAPVRTARPPLLADPGRARPSDVHLDRGLLQPDPPPLHPRLPLTRRLRDRDSGMIPTPTPSVIRGPLHPFERTAASVVARVAGRGRLSGRATEQFSGVPGPAPCGVLVSCRSAGSVWDAASDRGVEVRIRLVPARAGAFADHLLIEVRELCR